MHPALIPILADQSGVVARRQAGAAGVGAHDLARLVRRRELTRLHPGVFVDHTGEPSWLQLAWAAVLLHDGSALGGSSALRAFEGPGSRRPESSIELVVGWDRHLRDRPGIVVRRLGDLESRVMWHLGPPRLRYEEAVLEVVSRTEDRLAAVGELARAVQTRRTTAGRLLDRLAERERYPGRAWVAGVLRDVQRGTCSVLEHGYLHRVEKAHGLAPARRQVVDRLGSGVVYRDVVYAGGLVVELDGRLFHDTAAQRDRDFDRDLDAAVAGKDTVRLGWGQVFDRQCWTAERIGRLLLARGWPERPTRCGSDCEL